MRWLALFLAVFPGIACADAVVASRTLRPGTIMTIDDVAVATDKNGDITELDQVVGLELRMMVSQGRVILPSYLSAPTVIARNQIVTLAYQNNALRIETEGRALSAGSVNQVIRVINNTSRVTVSGRIAADGTVIVEHN